MGLFGGGALRRQIAALTEQLEAARKARDEAVAAQAAAEKRADERDADAKKARDQKRKSDKKLNQIKSARQSADNKAQGLQEKIDHLESELGDFRRAMLDSKNEAEMARARVAELEAQLDGARRIAAGPQTPARPSRPAPAEAQGETQGEGAADEAPKPERPRRQDDARVERLREQLAAERDKNRDLKERIIDAERNARGADKRRVAAIDKAEAAVRDLQHHLRSERRAYKILQLQFEAQIDRTRGAEQAVQARVEAELAKAAEGEPEGEAEAGA